MRIVLFATASLLVAAGFTATDAKADLAPPAGFLIDVASLESTTTASYTLFSANFTADQSTTYVSFLFRRDPSYFAFDDASVTLLGGGPNLLADPGFESGPVGSDTPIGWGNFQQTSGIGATGIVDSGGGRGGEGPRSGDNFWDDGSVGAYDGIYQEVATVPGQDYTVSFYLANPGSGEPYSQTGDGIDALAYAGDALPDGTVVTNPAPPASAPEPASLALFGAGLAGIGWIRRRAG